MPLANDYVNELRHELKMFPVWPPETPVTLGDYGTLTRGIFQRRGNIGDFGITLETLPDSDSRDIEYKSDGKIEVTTLAEVQGGVPGAQGHLTKRVEFSDAHAVLLSAVRCVYQVASNYAHIDSELQEKLNGGVWRKEWVVVTGLVRAESATILVSSAANASIDLQLEGEIPQAHLAGARLGIKVAREASMGLKVLAHQGATPLIMLSRLQKRYKPFWPIPDGYVFEPFGAPAVQTPHAPAVEASLPQLALIEPDIMTDTLETSLAG